MSEERPMSEERIPIILCCGLNGRAVVYGRVNSEPVKGEPVILHDARMVLHWAGNHGLFGVAAYGPGPGSRISPAVERTQETVWQEHLVVSVAAAAKIEAWDE